MTIINERYQLYERLGEGGMAVVYRAKQLNLAREVAIKFIKTDAVGSAFITRFEREAKSIAQLNHPNITQVYDFDRTPDGQPFMVMELLQGQDLSQFLARQSSLAMIDIVTIIGEVAVALQYAHARKIIHRDIKPSNIFITQQRKVKLMDFGLAKHAADTGITHSGVLLGTPKYFSPEQATGLDVDHRSDIYSLGVIFYQMLTNRLPFEGDNLVRLALQHATEPVPDPSDYRPDLSPQATSIVLRMLAKEPDERYPNADALLVDLARYEQNVKTETGVLPKVEPQQDIQATLDTTQASLDTTEHGQPTLIVESPVSSPSILTQSVRLPVSLLVVLVLLVLAGSIFIVGWLTQGDDGEQEQSQAALNVVPATQGEYLVLVGEWGEEDDRLDQRITDVLSGSDAIANSPHVTVRVEMTEREITTVEDAAELAESVGAHLVVWGFRDELGVEIVFQDIFAEENSADVLRFIVPNNEEYNSILTQDVPVALRFYLGSMLLHHFVRNDDIDGLAGYGFSTSGGTLVEELRIIPPRDIDRHILDLFNSETDESLIDSISAALRLVPGDPSLVFLRGFNEAFYNGDYVRAQADADRLEEMLGVSNLSIWMHMNLSTFEQDYDRILELSEDLDTTVPGYGIPFSYRQAALLFTGDYPTIQEEIQGEITEQEVFGLPVWDTLEALTFAIQGDDESFEAARDVILASRELEEGASFVTAIPTPPPIFLFFAGSITELSGNLPLARFVYSSALLDNPDDYLLNWRLGTIAVQEENPSPAYEFLQAALDNAPGPFPIALFMQAQLMNSYPEDEVFPDGAPDDVLSDCELLTMAAEGTSEDPEFYAPLIEKITQAEDDWACAT